MPGFGPPDARLPVVGLASQPTSTATGDGLEPRGVRVTSPVSLDGLDLFGCCHVSRRTTFTGRLTPRMLRGVPRAAADV